MPPMLVVPLDDEVQLALNDRRWYGTTADYIFDVLGSTVGQATGSFGSAGDQVYKAFGEILQNNGTLTGPFLWNGRLGYYYDTALGTYYVRARNYAPTIGRWTSIDPLGLGPDINWLRYAVNNVINWVDQSGNLTVTSNFQWAREGAKGKPDLEGYVIAGSIVLEYENNCKTTADCSGAKKSSGDLVLKSVKIFLAHQGLDNAGFESAAKSYLFAASGRERLAFQKNNRNAADAIIIISAADAARNTVPCDGGSGSVDVTLSTNDKQIINGNFVKGGNYVRATVSFTTSACPCVGNIAFAATAFGGTAQRHLADDSGGSAQGSNCTSAK
jgi:RHS repeat-associated protein